MKLTFAFIFSMCLTMILHAQISKTVNNTAGSLSTVLTHIAAIHP